MSVQVLLVEDNPAQAHLTIEAFRDALVQCQISTVEDGEAALSFLKREPPYGDAPRPDLIVLDLNLPKLDGLRVLQKIKQDRELLDIPVTVLTVSSNPVDVRKAYRLQAAGYLVKPSNLDEYFMAVRRLKEIWLQLLTLPQPTAETDAAAAEA
jgi:CheY-like chemotaxis protein